MTYKQLDRKASALVTKVQNRINTKGAYENAGQKELRDFEDILSASDLTYSEKFQLKSMMISRIDNLNY
jgi:hypothetical protein